MESRILFTSAAEPQQFYAATGTALVLLKSCGSATKQSNFIPHPILEGKGEGLGDFFKILSNEQFIK
jgi:hypothetical protein